MQKIIENRIGRVIKWRSMSSNIFFCTSHAFGTSLAPAAKCPLTHAKLEARPNR
jgi:hypothetical protein